MTEQAMPTMSDRPAVQDLVIADIEQRKTVGLERYGTLLRTFNGRNVAQDAYEEVLDLAQYWRQLLDEWKAIQPVVDAAVAWRHEHRPIVAGKRCDELAAAVDALQVARGEVK